VPLLTVVTISKNNPSGFKKTLESLLNANLKTNAVRLLVINGGTELSLKRDIKDLSILESDQIEIITGQDKGIFNAMNLGLEMVDTPYVFFLNAGDVFSKDLKFDSLIQKIQETGGNWMITNAFFTAPSGKIQLWKYVKPLSLKHKFCLNSFPHHATIYKTDFIKKNGGYVECSPFADWELSIRLSQIEAPKRLNLVLAVSEPFNYSASFSKREWAIFTWESRVRLTLTSSRLRLIKVSLIYLLKVLSAMKNSILRRLKIK